MKTKSNIKHNFRVGDGVTVSGYTDQRAYTVTAVTACTITIQRDIAVLLNGASSGQPDALTVSPGGFVGHTSGTQRYQYENSPDGEKRVARLSKKPYMRWTKGAGTDYPGAYGYVAEAVFTVDGKVVSPGRHEHYDFNF